MNKGAIHLDRRHPEVYRLTFEREGRETAIFKATMLEKDFKVVDVGPEIAKVSAELRHRYNASMADCIIAATALSLKATCLLTTHTLNRYQGSKRDGYEKTAP